MQMRYVKQAAQEGGVGLKGVKIRIDRDPEKASENFYFLASTADNGKEIILFPRAFTDTETLVKTLGHERQHILQRQLYGKDVTQETMTLWEDAAYSLEDLFWDYYKLNKSGKLDRFN